MHREEGGGNYPFPPKFREGANLSSLYIYSLYLPPTSLPLLLLLCSTRPQFFSGLPEPETPGAALFGWSRSRFFGSGSYSHSYSYSYSLFCKYFYDYLNFDCIRVRRRRSRRSRSMSVSRSRSLSGAGARAGAGDFKNGRFRQVAATLIFCSSPNCFT